MDLMIGTDVYLRTTDQYGKSFVSSHRVWDIARFVSTAEASAKKAGSKVAVISESDYKREKNDNR